MHDAIVSFRATLANLRIVHPPKRVDLFTPVAAIEEKFAGQSSVYRRLNLWRPCVIRKLLKQNPCARWRVAIP